jgi:hypothetical protein
VGFKCASWYQKLSISVCFAMLITASTSYAWLQEGQQSVTSAYECTQVSLEDVDSALLTKQERIALLDDSLTDSIDSYSSCVSSAAQNMSGGGSGQGAGGGQSGSEEANAQQNLDDLENIEGTQSSQQKDPIDLPQEIPETAQIPTKGIGSNPATRGIIPPKNNDKIICKLLFQEITKTQDPDMLKGLKQQYSNYKCG